MKGKESMFCANVAIVGSRALIRNKLELCNQIAQCHLASPALNGCRGELAVVP